MKKNNIYELDVKKEKLVLKKFPKSKKKVKKKT